MGWLAWPDLWSLYYLWVSTTITLASIALLTTILILIILKARASKVRGGQDRSEVSIGFFHPYCNAGGGGERVLWCAVMAVQTRYPAARIVIYTGDTDAAPDQILARARERFDMDIQDTNLTFKYLHR